MSEKAYTIDEMWEAKQKSFKDGFDHRQPSEPTLNFMKETTETMKEVRDGFIKIKGDVEHIKEKVDDIDTKCAMKDVVEKDIEIINDDIKKTNDRITKHDVIFSRVTWVIVLAVLGTILYSIGLKL